MPQAHATLQMLTELDDGGVQRAVARAADDATTVRLIRVHLRDLRDQLLRGDLGALQESGGARHPRIPQPPHGAAGVLLAGYRDVPDGGEITYQRRDAALVAALHAWFRALAAGEGVNVVIAHRPAADAAGVAR
jgi:hypothetical protein